MTIPPSRKFALTIYANRLAVQGRSATGTFETLVSLLSKRAVRQVKDGRAFSPYRLIPGTTRSNSNVEFFSMAVVDVDDGLELKYLRSTLEPYAWIAYSSHNHTAEHHKYRVILPLARDVPAQNWPRLWAGLSAFIQGHNDPAVKDLSRLYFLPSCPAERQDEAFFEGHDGALLDPDILFALAPNDLPQAVPRAAKTKAVNAFGAALEYPNSYADVVAEKCATIRWFKETGAPHEPVWHKCVGVLKHTVDGGAKIHEWSAEYAGYDADETQRKIDAWGAGPTTCEIMRAVEHNQCAGCRRACKSPIQLGQIIENKPVDIESVQEIEIDITGMSDADMLKKIWHARVSERNGGLYFKETVEDKDTGEDVVRETLFCKTVFYPVDLVRNEEGEWEMVMEYLTQYNQKRQFRMPTAHLASLDKMASTLAAHTIFIEGKNGRSFAMSHMKEMVLGLQAHRKEVITEEAFGWNADGDSFIIGHTMITPNAEKQVKMSEHIVAGGMAKDYGAAGTRNDWVRLVDTVYNRPGAEMYQFAFLVAAASPLISMVGIDGFHGVPVAYTGDGGRGKTTACELACSMWGRGELFKQSSSKGGSTINGLLAKTAIYRHLPFVMDELTGQDIREVGDMLYALSNGQNKVRLGPSGSFAGKILHWDLFSFVTGNMDITGLLSTLDRQMSEAVSVRCFEVKVPADINETVFAGVDFKTLVDIDLRKNYGVVGRQLIRAYVKHRDKVVALVHRKRQEFQPSTADETRERFYVDLICFALAAGAVMKKLDLIRFDLDGIKKWAFDNVKALRRARTERQITTDDMVGDFISALHDSTIVTKSIVDMRRNAAPEVPLLQLREDPLARKVTGDKRFFVAAKAFQVYGKLNGVAPSVIREALDRAGYILHVTGKSDPAGGFNFRLGQGTTMTTGLARCFELDYAKVHGMESAGNDNVVPIKTPTTGSATEETTEAA